LRLSKLNKSTTIITIVLLVTSISLGAFSYNYFTQTAKRIQELAIEDMQTSLDIEVHGISDALSNAFTSVISNLEVIANTTAITKSNILVSQTLLDAALSSTRNLTDGYYLLDKNGTLVAFTGMYKEENAKYIGINLSYRDYFQVPKQNGTLHVSTVIESNDNVPRMYISVPIVSNSTTDPMEIENNARKGSAYFDGIVFASITPEAIGKFLKAQIHPQLSSIITFIDRNGTILYSADNPSIGKKYFGTEYQLYVDKIFGDRKDEFNTIVKKATVSNDGVEESISGNTTTTLTIAYKAVIIPTVNSKIITVGNEDRIGTLFMIVPHKFAENVISLIENQKTANFFVVTAIATMSISITIILLRWNNILKEIINKKTKELTSTVNELMGSNKELSLTKQLLEKSNNDLLDANANLRVHDNMQKEFINTAAHELRTPIQPILGASSILANNMIGKKEKELLELISRNAKRLRNLAEEILDVTKIEAHSMNLYKEECSLAYLITQSISNYKNDMVAKGVRFKYDIDKNIVVYVDKNRIGRVISNLISNSIKALSITECKDENEEGMNEIKEDKNKSVKTKNGMENDGKCIISVTAEIKEATAIVLDRNPQIKLRSDSNMIKDSKEMVAVISIRDTGTGIDEDIFRKLFTKFTTKSHNGIGLGLYISKNIIEAHGGKIWAENNKDEKGATISFSLPLRSGK
jgi:signal transduction histidine kinase